MSLDHSYFRRDARELARALLGTILVTEIGGERTSGRIVETEAYLGVDDEASHSHRGRTARNAAMFLAGGHAYVYLIYGMYWCFNVVSGDEGMGEAVLIRAVEPLEGTDVMRRRRGARAREKELANGPGKLAIALGIGPELDGADLVTDPRIRIEAGEPVPADRVRATPRIGITKAADLEWRFVVSDRVVSGSPR